MRQLWRALHAIPQLLLVQPEHLSFDLVYALALIPPVVVGILFFGRNFGLLIALCILTGIVCLLALQLARLTLSLPPWVAHKATNPLVASLLVACFLSPQTPDWLAVSLVALLVILDTLVWPLLRFAAHPALVVFGILFIVQRQLPVGFVNPFDGRRLDDPLMLWHRLGLVIDPVKLYVGNVPGPAGATSAAALLIGIAYLWYARKISITLIAGFLLGVAAVGFVYRFDLPFQLSSGPSLFLVGYIAADRRRIAIPDRFILIAGAAAGGMTVVLRNYGQGQEATWQALLVVGAVVTAAVRVRSVLSARQAVGVTGRPAFRKLTVSSANQEHRPASAPNIPVSVRQPAMAVAARSSTMRRSVAPQPAPRYDTSLDSNDLVRQMRSAAGRGPLHDARSNRLVWAVTLFLINPVGLWLTWSSGSLSRRTKEVVSGFSALWYLAVAGLFLALTHGLLKA